MCTIVLKGATRIIKAEIAIIAKSEKKKVLLLPESNPLQIIV